MSSWHISPLAWDTDYFGIRCGKLVLKSPVPVLDDLEQALSSYDFVTIQNIGNNMQTNCSLGLHTSAYLADINIHFEKTAVFQNTDERMTVCPATELREDVRNQLTVEESDFSFSKFVCDPQFAQRKGYLVYEQWLKNACNADNKYFCCYFDGDKLAAFILFSIADDKCTAELVMVKADYRGHRIGSSMLHCIENYAYTHDIHTLCVGTQINNIPAINLYHAMGFRETERTSVYHYWNPSVR